MNYYIRAVQGYSCHGGFSPGATQGDGIFNDICHTQAHTQKLT